MTTFDYSTDREALAADDLIDVLAHELPLDQLGLIATRKGNPTGNFALAAEQEYYRRGGLIEASAWDIATVIIQRLKERQS